MSKRILVFLMCICLCLCAVGCKDETERLSVDLGEDISVPEEPIVEDIEKGEE